MDLDISFLDKMMKIPVYVKIDAHEPLVLSEGVCRQMGILYSRKYWRELNLAVWSKTDITKILAYFNLAVRYGIAIICTYTPKKFWRILIWRL